MLVRAIFKSVVPRVKCQHWASQACIICIMMQSIMFSDLCFGITYSEHIAYMYIVHICNVF